MELQLQPSSRYGLHVGITTAPALLPHLGALCHVLPVALFVRTVQIQQDRSTCSHHGAPGRAPQDTNVGHGHHHTPPQLESISCWWWLSPAPSHPGAGPFLHSWLEAEGVPRASRSAPTSCSLWPVLISSRKACPWTWSWESFPSAQRLLLHAWGIPYASALLLSPPFPLSRAQSHWWARHWAS